MIKVRIRQLESIIRNKNYEIIYKNDEGSI